MKIAVISPSPSNLQAISKTLEAHSHSTVLVEGGKNKMRAVAEQEQPDLILVEGMCSDPSELAQVEYLTTHHPQLAVILLCSSNTPEFLINSMRAGVREVLPSPVTPAALEAAVSRVEAKMLGANAKKIGKILAFIPCKGGSGATFLATNLGFQLSVSKSVLLIDLNMQFGDALSFMHDRKPASTLADIAHDITRLDASFLSASVTKISTNFSILAAPEDPGQAMEVKPEHIEAILSLAVVQYDFVVLDVGRTLDTLTIKALDRAYRIFPVLQMGLPYIRNANKLLTVFKSLGYQPDKIELIINRFEKGGQISTDDVQRSLAVRNLRTIPNSYEEVSTAINQGHLLAELARSNVVTKALAEFAMALAPQQEETRSLLGRLFNRA
jgi:pilus assembly protein CpaE